MSWLGPESLWAMSGLWRLCRWPLLSTMRAETRHVQQSRGDHMHNKRMKMLPLTAAVLLTWAGTASALDFHGYFRSGLGASSKDGGMECFRLAGVRGNGNFRLGKECETYGEAQFDQNVFDGKDGVKFDYHVMFGYATTQQADFENLASPDNHIAL